MASAVYIVDDDGGLRGSLQALISTALDVPLKGFASGDAFLAERAALAPGCVVLDFNMPGISGLDVMHALKQDAEKFQVVFLTGQGDIALAVQALKAGAFDFLEKPCDPEVLLEAVRQATFQLERNAVAAERVRDAEAKIARLTGRESEVLTHLIRGRSNKVIAYELDISPRTVEIYRANVMDKLGVRSLSDALRIAFTAGLVLAH